MDWTYVKGVVQLVCHCVIFGCHCSQRWQWMSETAARALRRADRTGKFQAGS